MNLGTFLSSFLFPQNHPTQVSAPALSLTAEDGSWKRTSDYVGARNLLLLGCKNLNATHTAQWLQEYSKADFYAVDQTPRTAAKLQEQEPAQFFTTLRSLGFGFTKIWNER